MAVDDRYKRASAMAIVLPFMHTVHTDTEADVDKEERWAATWIYIGIPIGEAATTDREWGGWGGIAREAQARDVEAREVIEIITIIAQKFIL